MSENGSRGHARAKRDCGSISHKVQARSSRSSSSSKPAALVERVHQRANHLKSARDTRKAVETLRPRDPLDKGCERSKLHSYLQSCDAMHLLDDIPGAEHVHFVDQSSLFHACRKKLLVGHHAQSGNRIYAYIVPSNELHRVELYTEHADGRSRLNLNRASIARHRILPPFNKVYPQGAQNTTQEDKTRFELVVLWYFVVTGAVQELFHDEAESFSIRFCGALRYIANQSVPAVDRSPHKHSVQRKRVASSLLASENDIQSYLLQHFSPMSRTPSIAAQHALENHQAGTIKETRNVVFEQLQAEAPSSSSVTGLCPSSPNGDQQPMSLQEQGLSRTAATPESSMTGLPTCREWCHWMKGWLFNGH